MKLFLTLAVFCGIATAVYAETCNTTCYTDAAGYTNCTQTCY